MLPNQNYHSILLNRILPREYHIQFSTHNEKCSIIEFLRLGSTNLKEKSFVLICLTSYHTFKWKTF